MVIRYERLKKQNRLYRALLGMNVAAFHHLLHAFAKAYVGWQEQQESQRESPRQRQRGGGRRAQLGRNADKLLFILFYVRHYPTQEVLGFLFGLSQPQANYWIQVLLPLLQEALGREAQLPTRKGADLATLLADNETLHLLIDGTERPIQRPHDPERQQAHYSGKKKRHTVKNIIIGQKGTRKVKGLGKTYEGRKHDKKAADEDAFEFPPGSVLEKDTGFQGYEPPGITTQQPKKKPRGKELTEEEKANNRTLSQSRIEIEHIIGGVKVFQIVARPLRHRKQTFTDLVMEVACGLHNFRCDFPLTA